jgi:hypothetical protein
MKTINNLNKEIDDSLFLPHNLPIYEYILMPNFGSPDFENFRKMYIQNNGKNLEEFNNKLEPLTVYAVFKNENNNPSFLFELINSIKQIHSQKSIEDMQKEAMEKFND